MWADELSRALGRPADAIRAHGLVAGDFPIGDVLALTFDDGADVRFRSAFHLTSLERRQAAVFSEHCGYHVFSALETRITRRTVGDA